MPYDTQDIPPAAPRQGALRVLAVSGSLRARSYNTALLDAIPALAPAGVSVRRFDGLGRLPLFNPDDDQGALTPAVQAWRTALGQADAVLIASPEYAFGVPGAMKNALDWVVSSGEFVNKPTAVLTASSSRMGGDKSNAALVQTLEVMMARIPAAGRMLVPSVGLTVRDDAVDREMQALLARWLDAVLAEARGG